jgi:branched-chain amino acid transport system permease protein
VSGLSLLVQMGLAALLALSVSLPLRCGQLSLATPGFYAIGGYVAALLSTCWQALGGAAATYPLPSLLLEMGVAALVAGAVAQLVGRPVLQLRGIYLAIATIALVEMLRVLNLNLEWSGGAVGIFAIPQPFAGPGGYLAFTACCWRPGAGSAPGWSACAWDGRWPRSGKMSWLPVAWGSPPPR